MRRHAAHEGREPQRLAFHLCDAQEGGCVMRVTCAQCGHDCDKDAGAVNRARAIGANLYCDRKCAGLARRREVPLTEAERKEAKRIYDAKRREGMREELNAKKLAHYYANRERILVEHAVYRKKHMARHVEYCRQPAYKAWKVEYDKRYRANKEFGEFADAFLLLQDVEKEIEQRASKYEIYLSNGTLNKALTRRRALL
jgi:hypothetical protein